MQSTIPQEPLVVDGLSVEHCEKYTYLGSIFTSDGSISSVIREHAASKMCQLFKYINFIKKYNDIPFVVKRCVLNAALMSSVLYGCESWIGADLAPVAKIYYSAIKELLDVKLTTCNGLCYIEGGFIPLQSIVMARQKKWLERIQTERSNIKPCLEINCQVCNTYQSSNKKLMIMILYSSYKPNLTIQAHHESPHNTSI